MDNATETLTNRSRLPKHRGAIFQMEADQQGIALVEAKVESIKIYITVNPDDAHILDAKFFTYGGPVFTAVADAVCEHLKDIQMSSVEKMDASAIEALLRDDEAGEALSLEDPALQLVPKLAELLVESYPEKRAVALNARAKNQERAAKLIPENEWSQLSKEEKIKKIDAVIDANVRQALNADGGDMEIVDVQDDNKVIIRYSGACESCGASSGATLFYIENQLRDNVYAGLSVIPENNPYGSQEDWVQ